MPYFLAVTPPADVQRQVLRVFPDLGVEPWGQVSRGSGGPLARPVCSGVSQTNQPSKRNSRALGTPSSCPTRRARSALLRV